MDWSGYPVSLAADANTSRHGNPTDAGGSTGQSWWLLGTDFKEYAKRRLVDKRKSSTNIAEQQQETTQKQSPKNEKNIKSQNQVQWKINEFLNTGGQL